MMEYNPVSVLATYKNYTMSVQCINEFIYAAQLLLPLSAIHYTKPRFLQILLKFQVLSHVLYMKGKMWPFGNFTEII